MNVDIAGDTVCALVTAAALAQTGHQCAHYLPVGAVSESLARRRMPYADPQLSELFFALVDDGHIELRNLDAYVPQARLTFMSFQPGALDLAQQVAARISDAGSPVVLVNQGAFAVGTSESLEQIARVGSPDSSVVSFPDVLQDGVAFKNFTRPDHILLGTEDEASEQLIREVLRPFNRRRDVIQVMSRREAEFTKLAISGMLATRLSFMNDMASLADDLDVDIEKVRRGMAADTRIGDAYLYPGCGFGGPGFSRDVMRLADTLTDRHRSAGLLHYVLDSNERQKEILFRKFWNVCRSDIAGKTVAVWGASFKPGTNRVSNAPSLVLIQALLAQEVHVKVSDPMALEQLQVELGDQANLSYCEDPYAAADGAHALMLVTEWKQYWSPDWTRLKSIMATPLILDGRNIYSPEYLRGLGFDYRGVGRR